jgi:hypothetical protein
MGCAAFGRRIIVAGGEVPMLFRVNEIYDTATNTWPSATPMPVPRHGVSAVTLNDGVLMPAGGTVQGLLPTTHVDKFIPPLLPGDTTFDGFVNADDVTAVILAWGPCPAPPATCPADVDGSGTVDADDLVAVVLNWG